VQKTKKYNTFATRKNNNHPRCGDPTEPADLQEVKNSTMIEVFIQWNEFLRHRLKNSNNDENYGNAR
jgi:hypothetical protein